MPGCLPLHANERCTPCDAAGGAHKPACVDCGLVTSVGGDGAGTQGLRQAGQAGPREGGRMQVRVPKRHMSTRERQGPWRRTSSRMSPQAPARE